MNKEELKKVLDDLISKREKAEHKMLDLSREASALDVVVKQKENSTKLHVYSLTNDGKKVFTNDTSRKAEVEAILGRDEEHQRRLARINKCKTDSEDLVIYMNYCKGMFRKWEVLSRWE